MAKIDGKDFLRPTPKDWDPATGYARDEDDPALIALTPSQRRMWDEQVGEIRQKQRDREAADQEHADDAG